MGLRIRHGLATRAVGLADVHTECSPPAYATMDARAAVAPPSARAPSPSRPPWLERDMLPRPAPRPPKERFAAVCLSAAVRARPSHACARCATASVGPWVRTWVRARARARARVRARVRARARGELGEMRLEGRTSANDVAGEVAGEDAGEGARRAGCYTSRGSALIPRKALRWWRGFGYGFGRGPAHVQHTREALLGDRGVPALEGELSVQEERRARTCVRVGARVQVRARGRAVCRGGAARARTLV